MVVGGHIVAEAGQSITVSVKGSAMGYQPHTVDSKAVSAAS
jgi:hypothetical protein